MHTRVSLFFIPSLLVLTVTAVYITCESEHVDTCFDEEMNCYNCTKGTYIPYAHPTSNVMLLVTERVHINVPSAALSDSDGSTQDDSNSGSTTSSTYSSTSATEGYSSASSGVSATGGGGAYASSSGSTTSGSFSSSGLGTSSSSAGAYGGGLPSDGFPNFSLLSASGGLPSAFRAKRFDGLPASMRQEANATAPPPLFVAHECSTVTPALGGAAAMSATSRVQSDGSWDLCNAIFDFGDHTSSVMCELYSEASKPRTKGMFCFPPPRTQRSGSSTAASGTQSATLSTAEHGTGKKPVAVACRA